MRKNKFKLRDKVYFYDECFNRIYWGYIICISYEVKKELDGTTKKVKLYRVISDSYISRYVDVDKVYRTRDEAILDNFEELLAVIDRRRFEVEGQVCALQKEVDELKARIKK